MPRYSVTFEALESEARLHDCCICRKNRATLRCSGIRGGPVCLQCGFSMLAHLAEETVDQLAHLAS